LNLSQEEQLKLVIKQGWLLKRGEDLAKIWKGRYFLLIKEPKGLIYFKKNIFQEPEEQGHRHARGFVDFTELIGVSPHGKSAKRFDIVTTPRKWYLKANSLEERDQWMQAIEKAHGGSIVHGATGMVTIDLDAS